MKELSEKKRLEIIRLFLEGYSYDDISSKNDVAKGSVVNIVNDFRAGRFPAFSDVSDLVDTLRELSVELRRSGAGASEALLGLVFFSRLDEMGVKPPDVWTWSDMCRELSPPEAPLEEFMRAALELFRLKQETGESYSTLVARCSGMRTDAESLRFEVEELRKEKEELRGMNAALAEAQQELAKEKESLQKDIAELSSNREQLRREVTELEEKRSVLGRDVKELGTKAKGLRPEVNALEALGFRKTELETLRVKLAEAATSQGITGEELRIKFFQGLADYGAIDGFGRKREELESKIAALQAQEEHLECLTSRLRAPPEEVEEAVMALVSLKRRGVTPWAVASYYRVLSRAGVQPDELEQQILKLGVLRNTIEAFTKEAKRLEEEDAQHSKVVEALRAEEEGIKASIHELTESGQRLIQEVQEEAVTTVKEASQKMTEDIAEWGRARAELGAYLEDLKRARYFTRLPLSSQALEAFIDDIGPLVIGQYLQIGALWCSKKLNPKLRPPGWITSKYYKISEYSDIQLADLIRWSLEAFTQGVGENERRAQDNGGIPKGTRGP